MNGHDAWSAVAELAASQHGAFSRKQAAENSITAQQLRRAVTIGRVQPRLSDVFTIAGSVRSWRQRLMVASLAGAVVSHRSAAALHQLDGARPGIVEVTFRRNAVRPLPWARVHTSSAHDPTDVTTVDGIRVTSIARTLAELGAVTPIDQVEKALDSALRRGCPALWIDETLHRLLRPGPTGAGKLASLLADPSRAGALPDSWFERLVQRVFAASDLPRPLLQHVVQVKGQTRRLDLAWPEVRLGVEAHSRLFHFGRAADERDNRRDLELAAVGWELVYITWGMACEPESFVGIVSDIYRQRLRSVS